MLRKSRCRQKNSFLIKKRVAYQCIMYTTVSLLSVYIFSTSFILLVSLKLISIPKLHLMMAIWKYVDTLIREDHPSNSEQVGIYASYQNLLPLKVINVKYLQESISFDFGIRVKCCTFICFYRSPSHP